MKADFFTGNRQKLRTITDEGLVIIAGHDAMQSRADAAYPFVQEANFYYLTGILEAGWRLVMDGTEDVLVAPHRTKIQTLFDGSINFEQAKAISGIDTIIDQNDFNELYTSLRRNHRIVLSIGDDPHASAHGVVLNNGPRRNYRSLRRDFEEVRDIRPAIASLRSIKQPEEIHAMRTAIDETLRSFKNIYSQLQGYANEREISAQITFDFMRGTAEGHAYDPIVAGGANACTLHYTDNTSPLKATTTVLIDAGASYRQYAADITRTYAIGQPTPRQIAVHDAVEKAHYQIIDLIRPGLSTKEYSEQVDEIMKNTLKSLGLLKKPSDYRRYFPHAISHGLGIDVHESLGGHGVFKPGMVLTVEPGIYIPEEGIGVRIEDDILVTETGNENLSAALPTSL